MAVPPEGCDPREIYCMHERTEQDWTGILQNFEKSEVKLMKKLGLIGGIGPESTIEYYRAIEYGVQKKSGQNFFPNITIESLNVFEVLNLCKKQDYDGLTDYLLNGINQLSAAGVQYAALTGITTHIVFDALSKVSPVPLVSMVDTASEFARAHGCRKVCLLGTLPTMNGTFFQKSFESKGIEVITPDTAEKEYISRKIETELELGKVISDTQNNFRTITERIIRDENVDTIILGCTELPLIFKGIDLSVPCLNVMQVHIDSLIDLIMSE